MGSVVLYLGSLLVMHGLSYPQHVRSSRTRDQTGVLCVARQILNHWSTRGALSFLFLFFSVFIWLHWVLFAVYGIFSCSMWDLVPSLVIETGPP